MSTPGISLHHTVPGCGSEAEVRICSEVRQPSLVVLEECLFARFGQPTEVAKCRAQFCCWRFRYGSRWPVEERRMEDRPYRRCLPELRWIGSSSWFPDRDGNLPARDRQTRAVRTGQELSWIAFVEHSFGGAWIGRFPRFRKILIVSQFRFLCLRKFYFSLSAIMYSKVCKGCQRELAPRNVKWKKDFLPFLFL